MFSKDITLSLSQFLTTENVKSTKYLMIFQKYFLSVLRVSLLLIKADQWIFRILSYFWFRLCRVRLKRNFCLYCLVLVSSSLQTYCAIALSNTPSDAAERDYNLLIGNLRFNLGTGANFRWDSNFNRSNSNPETASSITPTISIDAYWPISPYLQFSTGTSIGYEYFFAGESNAQDGLIIGGINENATSRFDFDIGLSNDALITISNSFSANIASASFQNNAGQRQDQPFREFNSTTSLRYAQRLTPQTRFSSSYSFNNTFTKGVTNNNDTAVNTAVNDSLDSQTHSVFGEVSTQINNSLILGLEGNISDMQYSEKLRNDNRQYRIGPRITYISESGLTSSVYVALDQLDFDTSNNPVAQDNQSTTLTFQSSINFVQRNLLSHSFSFNHSQEPSNATTSSANTPGSAIPANFQENTNFTYNLGYPLNERLNFRLSYMLRKISESDGGNEYYNETISLGFPFRLNVRTSLSTSYTYFKTFGSEFTEFNYDQHQVLITFRFDI